MKSRLFVTACVVAWSVAIGAGVVGLWAYKSTPGDVGAVAAIWPTQVALRRVPGTATLIMLAHPHCPCTRATVSELARLMSRLPAPVTAHVLFVRPAGVAPGWERTGLVHDTAAIPGVSVLIDEDGTQARMFGALTSGQVLLYDAEGRLVFAGGITPARGHEGGSAGQQLFLAALSAGPGTTRARVSNVFGCALRDSVPEAAPKRL